MKKNRKKLKIPDVMPSEVPVLPIKDLVAFPHVMMALYVTRASLLQSVEKALASEHKLIFVATQRNADIEEPEGRDLYKVGVIAQVVKTLKLPEDRNKVLIQGVMRAKAKKYIRGDFLTAKVEAYKESHKDLRAEDEVLMNRIRDNLQLLVEKEYLPEEILLVTEETKDISQFSDLVLAHCRLDLPKAQSCLEEVDAIKRLRLTDRIISDDLNQFFLSQSIQSKTRDELNKGQREYYLREQIKQIRLELGEEDGSEDI